MSATNISINQQSSISINVETLQAIKQRVLGAVAKLSIINGPLGPMGRLRSITEQKWSIWRVYRHQLRLARALARAIDAHPTLSDIALWLMGIALAFEVFMFA